MRRGAREGGRAPRKAEADPPAADDGLHDPLKGRCLVMCPPEEAADRARTKELSKFETQAGGLPVKKYRRPAAGRVDVDLAELRPSRVLLETLQHLLAKVLSWPGCGFDWEVVGSPTRSSPPQRSASSDTEQLAFLSLYHFIADRMRSVRQDFTIQRVRDSSVVNALERIARFHILASFEALRLLHSREHEWSEQLNDQQLTSALAELRELYAKQRKAQAEASCVSSQSEFAAYDILLHASDPRAVSLMLPQVPAKILQSPSVTRAWRVFVALQTQDFHQFFVLFEQSSVLEKRLMMKHVPSVWASAVRMINKAFGKVDQFAMQELAQWMHVPSETQAKALCEAMNLSCFERSPPPASEPAESWESSTITTAESNGYVKFKLTVLNEVLDKAAAQKLLREVAWKIHHEEILSSHCASDMINGPTEREGH